jgi:hypothetical protein
MILTGVPMKEIYVAATQRIEAFRGSSPMDA